MLFLSKILILEGQNMMRNIMTVYEFNIFIFWVLVDTCLYFLGTHKFKLICVLSEEKKKRTEAIIIQLKSILFSFMIITCIGFFINIAKLTSLLPELDTIKIGKLEIPNIESVASFIIFLFFKTFRSLVKTYQENEKEKENQG